jgi:beta-lactamase class A
VCILDTATGEQATHRADERFPMCSTFKFLLAAAVLHRVDGRQESLQRQVNIPASITIGNSPLTEPHAGGRMTIADLCFAALTRSDNTAANLLLDTIGGPAGVTGAARSLGDKETRLDRNEPSLNSSIDGDPRDTTTPAAMAGNLRQVLMANALSQGSRAQLRTWMEGNQTGIDRLRKDMPAGWRAADKTGSNGEHTTNDIAVLFPPGGRAPVIVTAYITQCMGPEAKRAAILTEIGKMVFTAIG